MCGVYASERENKIPKVMTTWMKNVSVRRENVYEIIDSK